MKNWFLSLVFVLASAFAVVPAAADNATVFNEIRVELSELDSLLKIVSDGSIDIGWGYSVPLPSATRTAMITRMLELRTSIRAKLMQLAVE